LLQLVLEKIRRPRCSGSGRVRGCRPCRPGHNSSSHLVCSLSKFLHVTWLDGQGVRAPWPSPFVLHVCIDARCTGSRAWNHKGIHCRENQPGARKTSAQKFSNGAGIRDVPALGQSNQL
jgi:hypothetical protein